MRRILLAALCLTPGLWSGGLYGQKLGQPVAITEPTTAIRVDQAGYLTAMPKLALVAAPAAVTRFNLRRAGRTPDGLKVFEGTLGPPTEDPDSGDRVRSADFTRFTVPGEYVLEVPGVGHSWPFAIGPRVYRRALYLAARAFYGQRCGTAVDLGAEFPGYTHPACHRRGAYHPSSGKSGPQGSAKGWHDAGDYGRYVVNSGITTATLLWAWELYQPVFEELSLDIPESGDGVPDLLDEIRWNLDWMLGMQDEDGGVWHKQTPLRFAAFLMPEDDTAVSYVIGTGDEPFKSSCATADLAAVAAIAGRVYAPLDAGYARRSLVAAHRAWDWLGKHPDVPFHNPEDVSTGQYGDDDCGDERLWAAVELWRSTGDPRFHGYFRQRADEYRPLLASQTPISWAYVAPLPFWGYALSAGDRLAGGSDEAAANAREVAGILRDVLAAADAIVARSSRHGYRISLTETDYAWGSNGIAANYGLQLLVAHALRPDRRYLETALDNLHYLLGRNTFSLSWVTQVGANPFRHPHHRPSAADDRPEPWPGLLSGGPNRHRQDPAARELPDLPPARMYLDDTASFSTNEIAINWNAALVFLLAGALAGT